MPDAVFLSSRGRRTRRGFLNVTFSYCCAITVQNTLWRQSPRFRCLPLSTLPLRCLTLIIRRLPAGLLCREPWASLACAAGSPGEAAAFLCAVFGAPSAPRTEPWRLPHTEGHGRTHASQFVRGSCARSSPSACARTRAGARTAHACTRTRTHAWCRGAGRGAAHRGIGTSCRTRSSLEHSTPPWSSGWPSDAFRRRSL